MVTHVPASRRGVEKALEVLIVIVILLLLLWFVGELKTLVGTPFGGLMEYLSVTRHFDGFSKGVLDSRDLIYYFLFCFFFLFLTLRQMSSFRWRG